MYTRERRGIFRSNEGYDTIAKSAGLDNQFIKKTLHPFCGYDAPAELAAASEKDDTRYPESIHLFHTESGDTVLGRSVYQSADFTGLRSAFFTHNYVLPAGGGHQEDIASLLHADFERRYDLDRGTELPELGTLPLQTHAGSESVQEVLGSFGIGESLFKQLLFALLSSVSGKKKVYISLDVPAQRISSEAKRLIVALIGSLPYEFRRQLGFMTYAKEPQSKKGIHLMFVEKGSLRPNDRNIEKDYVFDFASHRALHADFDASKQPYLDFAWDNLSRPARAEAFYEFAGQMLTRMEPGRSTALAAYHELCVFFQIEEGNEALYQEHKSAVLNGMLDYLRPAGALAEKLRLNDLFLARFDREFDEVRQGKLPDPGVAECFKEYYPIDREHNETKIIEYFIRALGAAWSRQSSEQTSRLYGLIDSDPALGLGFFRKVLATEGLFQTLFEPYIREKFKRTAKAREVLKLVQEWCRLHPMLAGSTVFAELAKAELADKLRTEADLSGAVNGVMEQLRKLSREPAQSIPGSLSGGRFAVRGGSEETAGAAGKAVSPDWERLLESLGAAANRCLLGEIRLEALSKEQFLQIDFLKQGEAGRHFFPAQLDLRLKLKVSIMKSAYRLLTERSPEEAVFDDLSLTEIDRVQELGRGWLKSEPNPAQYGRIALLFYCRQENGPVDYAALLDYLRKNAGSPEQIYEFINWSAGSPLFTRQKALYPAYAAAVKSYFYKHDRDAFKQRARWNRYFAQAGGALKPVYEEARLELSSAFTKFRRKNGKLLKLASASFCITLVLIVAAAFVLKAAGVFDDDKPKEAVGAGSGGSVTKQPQAGDIAVYAEDAAQTAGAAETTRLVFLFRTAEQCGQFLPDSLAIESGTGSEPQQFSGLKPLPSCVDSAAAGKAPDAGGKVKAAGTPAAPASGAAGGETAPAAADPSAAGTAGGGANGTDAGKAPALDASQYPYRVTVPLGQKLTLQPGAVIDVGEQTFTLSAAPISGTDTKQPSGTGATPVSGANGPSE